jgi:hypothetical protein
MTGLADNQQNQTCQQWNGLSHVYGRETKADADIAHVLTMDEARRIAINIVSCQSYRQEVVWCELSSVLQGGEYEPNGLHFR